MEIRPAVRKLLRDADQGVRLSVARALVLAQEREAVPVLIDLLAELPTERTEEALLLLNQLAGDKAPSPPENDGSDEKTLRKRHQEAWATWWKDNNKRVDLAKLALEPTLLGYTLIANIDGSVTELGRDNKPRWTIQGGMSGPVDAWMLTGNRVLVSEVHGGRVTERDLTGKVLWEKSGLSAQPLAAQRLPNGHTFLATRLELMILDRSGKEVFSHRPTNQIDAAYRKRDGEIVYLRQDGSCVRLSSGGRELKTFPSGRTPGEQPCGVDVLPNGHILVSQTTRSKVVEFDAEGRRVREYDAPNVTTATALPNGHILAASFNTSRVFELDRSGKVVWEHKGNQPFRARRR